jgi:elongation factor Ts
MTITPEQVKNLREKTGVGMMLCKEALTETSGDTEKAILWLRQKGISIADGKIGKPTTNGRIGSYVHTGGRIGILIEVLCETDFLANSEEFQTLVHNLGMQVAACPSVSYVNVSDIPQEFVNSETQLEMSKDDLAKKPEAIRQRIVEGRVNKKLKEITLLSQPFIKDTSITIEELMKSFSAKVGENVLIKRFIRLDLGHEWRS